MWKVNDKQLYLNINMASKQDQKKSIFQRMWLMTNKHQQIRIICPCRKYQMSNMCCDSWPKGKTYLRTYN